MLRVLFIVLSLVSVQIDLMSQDGMIVTRENVNVFENTDLANKICVENEIGLLKSKYSYLDSVKIEKITYMSDGLKVVGYLAYPDYKEIPLVNNKFPSVIYNRGGNKDFGSLNEYKAVFILARIASWGYVVAASQYRGNDGGEGKEEFGGSDVNDILNLIPLLDNMEIADTSRMALYGWSRGGMMTYLTLSKTDRFKAAIVGGGLSDLWSWMETRNDTIESVYGSTIPNYAMNTKEALDSRSATKFADKISKTTPILMLHGSADWRVVPCMALDLSRVFLEEKIPHRLVMFEGGDHGLKEFREEVDEMVKEWLDKYLIGEGQLPDLSPHGR